MKEVNEKCIKEIFFNVLKAIFIIAYFLILNIAFEKVNAVYIERIIQLFTMIFLFISIFLIEKAYKKDNGNIAIQGIEVLVLSAYTLTTEHITTKFKFNFKSYSLVASYIFAIYFILKCIFIYTKGRQEVAEDLSDIREIVKKDEPIKKEATKKKKEKVEKSEEVKTEPEEKVELKEEIKPKRTRVKKEVKEND